MKNRENRKQLLSWLSVAAWMAVIFLFSAQNDSQSGDTSGAVVRWFLACIYRGFEEFSPQHQQELLDFWHIIIRKCAHFTEFGVLAMLSANALRLCGKLRWFLPVVISAAYAVTDEIHQYFVPGRACRLLDVGIDTCGAVFGTALFALGFFYLSKRAQKRQAINRDGKCVCAEKP